MQASVGHVVRLLPYDVRLVRLSWLMRLGTPGSALHAKYNGVMPRRQDLPEEAFIGEAELRRIGAGTYHYSFDVLQRLRELPSTGVGGLVQLFASMCAFRRNVDNLLPIIAISYVWLSPSHPDRDGAQMRLLCQRLRALPHACRRYGFREMGVFLE